MRVPVLLVVLLALAGCGDDAPQPEPGVTKPAPPAPTPAPWRRCRLAGVKQAGGLTLYKGDLLVVCGKNDRAVRAFGVRDLQPGTELEGRSLAQQVTKDAMLMGGEPFALQGYKLEHLWAQKLDFQALAVQSPNFVYLGDRVRRVCYWGALLGDQTGRTDRVLIKGVFIVPGAKRTDTEAGDWRDKGPGLAGFASIGKGRASGDFYAVDRGASGGRLRIHRVNRFATRLGPVRVRHGYKGPLAADALSLHGRSFLLLHGAAPGTLSEASDPLAGETVGLKRLEAAPAPPAGETWTGMCHGPDGTLYLISNGAPAQLAWRAR